MRVRDVMTVGVIDIGMEETAADAMRKMFERRVGSLVVAGSGMVTRRDVLSKVIARGKNPEEVRVSEIMSGSLVTVHPDASVEDMAKIISNRDIGKFPVVYDNKIIGFVSSSDVLRAVMLERD